MSNTNPAVQLRSVVAAVLITFAANGASAYNIGFDTLGGNNDDVFSGHSEGTFTVTPVAGDWRVGKLFGDPIPNIFGVPPTLATVRVTDSMGDLFTFDSVTLAGVSAPTATYTVEGFRNNVSQLVTGGTLNIANVFFNIPSPNPAALLDRLDITISGNTATSFNVDNIIVNRVIPEPTTVALLTAFSFGVFLKRRSRIG